VAKEIARTIVLDCETYRTREPRIVEQIQQEAMAKRTAKSAAKAVKLEWDATAARYARAEEALAKTAVDVHLAEILCVCWREDGEPGAIDAMSDDAGEVSPLAQLAEYWDRIATAETVWVGHNIIGFDLPVLVNNWRRRGIVPPTHFPTCSNGRWRGRIYDTMARSGAKPPCHIQLETLCAAYNVLPPARVMWGTAPLDGSRVGAAYEFGVAGYQRILEYCAADVAATEALYRTMTLDGRYGTYNTRDEVAAQIQDIEAAVDLSDAQKALAIVGVLDGAGLVPRR